MPISSIVRLKKTTIRSRQSQSPSHDRDRTRLPSDRRLPTADRRLPTARRVLTVTELTVRVRDLLETEFFEVWVEGELSNCRVWNTGHLYFTLKDASTQVRAVIFRSALRYLKFKPADGLARGRARPRLGLRAQGRVPADLRASGAARPRRAAARVRSAEEAAAGRRAVRPGAQTAAARPAPQDRHRHLARRRGDPRHHQGAPPPVRERASRHSADARPGRRRGARDCPRRCEAIGRVPGVDVVIVGRGGGSIEDLWAFNEEVVARAIAAVAGSGDFRRRARDRCHDRRLRRGPPGADALGGGRDRRRGEGRLLQPDRSPARPAGRRRARRASRA